ncbi:MAG TPA: hypothetical protein VJ903_05400, partial [Clostridia bacterium]|nr:hypothetical protein [Clostridia bacterium]
LSLTSKTNQDLYESEDNKNTRKILNSILKKNKYDKARAYIAYKNYLRMTEDGVTAPAELDETEDGVTSLAKLDEMEESLSSYIINLNSQDEINAYYWNEVLVKAGDYLLGDVASLYLIVDDNGILDAYIDLAFLNADPIKIVDARGILKVIALEFGIVLEDDENVSDDISNASPNIMNASDTANLIAKQIVLSVATSNDVQPLLLKVTGAAIFGLLQAMGIDIERYFGTYTPSLELDLFNNTDVANLTVILEDLFSLRAAINYPKVSLTNTLSQAIKQRKYTSIDQNWDTDIKIFMEGELDLGAEDAEELGENNSDLATINFGEILRGLMGDESFALDVILKTINSVATNLNFRLEAKLNIIRLYSEMQSYNAAITAYNKLSNVEQALVTKPALNLAAMGVEAYIEINGKFRVDETETEKLIIGVYLVPQGDILNLYLDLNALNMGRVMITDIQNTATALIDRLGGMFSKEVEEEETEEEEVTTGTFQGTLGEILAIIKMRNQVEENIGNTNSYEYYNASNSEDDSSFGYESSFENMIRNAGLGEGAVAFTDYIKGVIGNSYGFTVTAAANVLIKVLNEAFNDTKSRNIRSFRNLIENIIRNDQQQEVDNIQSQLQNMDEALVLYDSSKADAWSYLLNEIFDETQRINAQAIYATAQEVLQDIYEDGYSYIRYNNESEQNETISVDGILTSYNNIVGYYWTETVDVLTYNTYLASYNKLYNDYNELLENNFTKLPETGINTTEKSLPAQPNSITTTNIRTRAWNKYYANLIADMESANLLLDQGVEGDVLSYAKEFTAYYVKSKALDNLINVAKEKLDASTEALEKAQAYVTERIARGEVDAIDRESKEAEYAFDYFTSKNTWDSDDAKYYATLQTIYKESNNFSEPIGKRKAWADIKQSIDSVYATIIAAMTTVNTVMVDPNGKYLATETAFIISNGLYTGYSDTQSLVWKSVAWDLLLDSLCATSDRQLVIVDDTDSSAPPVVPGGINPSEELTRVEILERLTKYNMNTDFYLVTMADDVASARKTIGKNEYLYTAWIFYYDEIKRVINGNDRFTLQYIFNYEYDSNGKIVSSSPATETMVVGNTTVNMVKMVKNEVDIEKEYNNIVYGNELTYLDALYIDSYDRTAENIITATGDYGQIQINIMHDNKLLGVEGEVANLNIGISFISAGLKIKDNDLAKIIKKTETDNQGDVIETEIIQVIDSEYLSGLNFVEMNEDFTYIYASMDIDFSWDMSENASYDFSDLISSMIGGIELGPNTINLAPILQVLEGISGEFRIHLEAKINLFDIIDGSDAAITLYKMDGEGNYSAFRKDTHGNYLVDEEGDLIPQHVLQIIYGTDADGSFVFVDAESFNIQKLYIVDAIDYVKSLLLNSPYPVGVDLEEETSMSRFMVAAMAKAYLEQDENEINGLQNAATGSQYPSIDLLIKDSGFVVQIGASALYALLSFLGMGDIKTMISKVGEPGIEVVAFGEDIFAFNLELFGITESGQAVESQYIRLGVALNSVNVSLDQDASISFDEITDLEWDANGDPVGFALMKEQLPPIHIETTILLELDANEYTTQGVGITPLDELEPLKSLLKLKNGEGENDYLLLYTILDIALLIKGNSKMTIAVDIKANLDFGDGTNTDYLQNLINNSEINIKLRVFRSSDGQTITDPNRVFASISYYNQNLYIDLTNLGGDKIYIEKVGEMIFGSEEAQNLALNGAIAELKNAVAGNSSIGANIDITSAGLFLIVKKAAIVSLMQILGLSGFDMFDEAAIQLYLIGKDKAERDYGNSLKVGLQIGVGTNGMTPGYVDENGNADMNEVLGLGFCLNGILVGFTKIDLSVSRPEEYKKIGSIDTLYVSTQFSLSLSNDSGAYTFGQLLKMMLANSSLNFERELEPILELVEELDSTLYLGVSLTVNINSILDELQAQIGIYKTYADSVAKTNALILLTYIRGDIYIDATGISNSESFFLGKVKMSNLMDIIGMLTSSGDAENLAFVQEMKAYEDMMDPQNRSSAYEDINAIIATARLVIDVTNGVVVELVDNALITIADSLLDLRDKDNNKISLGDYVNGITMPEIAVGVNTSATIFVDIRLPSAVYNDSDYEIFTKIMNDVKADYGFSNISVEYDNNDWDKLLKGNDLYALYSISNEKKIEYVNNWLGGRADVIEECETLISTFSSRHDKLKLGDIKVLVFNYIILQAYKDTSDATATKYLLSFERDASTLEQSLNSYYNDYLKELAWDRYYAYLVEKDDLVRLNLMNTMLSQKSGDKVLAYNLYTTSFELSTSERQALAVYYTGNVNKNAIDTMRNIYMDNAVTYTKLIIDLVGSIFVRQNTWLTYLEKQIYVSSGGDYVYTGLYNEMYMYQKAYAWDAYYETAYTYEKALMLSSLQYASERYGSNNSTYVLKAYAFDKFKEELENYATLMETGLLEDNVYILKYIVYYESMLAHYGADYQVTQGENYLDAEEMFDILIKTVESIQEYNLDKSIMLNQYKEAAIAYDLIFDTPNLYMTLTDIYHEHTDVAHVNDIARDIRARSARKLALSEYIKISNQFVDLVANASDNVTCANRFIARINNTWSTTLHEYIVEGEELNALLLSYSSQGYSINEASWNRLIEYELNSIIHTDINLNGEGSDSPFQNSNNLIGSTNNSEYNIKKYFGNGNYIIDINNMLPLYLAYAELRTSLGAEYQTYFDQATSYIESITESDYYYFINLCTTYNYGDDGYLVEIYKSVRAYARLLKIFNDNSIILDNDLMEKLTAISNKDYSKLSAQAYLTFMKDYKGYSKADNQQLVANINYLYNMYSYLSSTEEDVREATLQTITEGVNVLLSTDTVDQAAIEFMGSTQIINITLLPKVHLYLAYYEILNRLGESNAYVVSVNNDLAALLVGKTPPEKYSLAAIKLNLLLDKLQLNNETALIKEYSEIIREFTNNNFENLNQNVWTERMYIDLYTYNVTDTAETTAEILRITNLFTRLRDNNFAKRIAWDNAYSYQTTIDSVQLLKDIINSVVFEVLYASDNYLVVLNDVMIKAYSTEIDTEFTSIITQLGAYSLENVEAILGYDEGLTTESGEYFGKITEVGNIYKALLTNTMSAVSAEPYSNWSDIDKAQAFKLMINQFPQNPVLSVAEINNYATLYNKEIYSLIVDNSSLVFQLGSSVKNICTNFYDSYMVDLFNELYGRISTYLAFAEAIQNPDSILYAARSYTNVQAKTFYDFVVLLILAQESGEISINSSDRALYDFATTLINDNKELIENYEGALLENGKLTIVNYILTKLYYGSYNFETGNLAVRFDNFINNLYNIATDPANFTFILGNPEISICATFAGHFNSLKTLIEDLDLAVTDATAGGTASQRMFNFLQITNDFNFDFGSIIEGYVNIYKRYNKVNYDTLYLRSTVFANAFNSLYNNIVSEIYNNNPELMGLVSEVESSSGITQARRTEALIEKIKNSGADITVMLYEYIAEYERIYAAIFTDRSLLNEVILDTYLSEIETYYINSFDSDWQNIREKLNLINIIEMNTNKEVLRNYIINNRNYVEKSNFLSTYLNMVGSLTNEQLVSLGKLMLNAILVGDIQTEIDVDMTSFIAELESYSLDNVWSILGYSNYFNFDAENLFAEIKALQERYSDSLQDAMTAVNTESYNNWRAYDKASAMNIYTGNEAFYSDGIDEIVLIQDNYVNAEINILLDLYEKVTKLLASSVLSNEAIAYVNDFEQELASTLLDRLHNYSEIANANVETYSYQIKNLTNTNVYDLYNIVFSALDVNEFTIKQADSALYALVAYTATTFGDITSMTNAIKEETAFKLAKHIFNGAYTLTSTLDTLTNTFIYDNYYAKCNESATVYKTLSVKLDKFILLENYLAVIGALNSITLNNSANTFVQAFVNSMSEKLYNNLLTYESSELLTALENVIPTDIDSIMGILTDAVNAHTITLNSEDAEYYNIALRLINVSGAYNEWNNQGKLQAAFLLAMDCFLGKYTLNPYLNVLWNDFVTLYYDKCVENATAYNNVINVMNINTLVSNGAIHFAMIKSNIESLSSTITIIASTGKENYANMYRLVSSIEGQFDSIVDKYSDIYVDYSDVDYESLVKRNVTSADTLSKIYDNLREISTSNATLLAIFTSLETVPLSNQDKALYLASVVESIKQSGQDLSSYQVVLAQYEEVEYSSFAKEVAGIYQEIITLANAESALSSIVSNAEDTTNGDVTEQALYLPTLVNNIEGSGISVKLLLSLAIAKADRYINGIFSQRQLLDEAILKNGLYDYQNKASYSKILQNITLIDDINDSDDLTALRKAMKQSNGYLSNVNFPGSYISVVGFMGSAEVDSIVANSITMLSAYNDIYAQATVKRDQQANIRLGIGVLGEIDGNLSTSVKVGIKSVYVDEHGQLTSTIKDLISDEEKDEYTEYSDLTLRVNINATLNNLLTKGNLNIQDVLNAINFGSLLGMDELNVDLDIAFLEAHTMKVTISGQLGINFSALLSQDINKINNSIIGDITLSYYLIDHDTSGQSTRFKQIILHVWIYGNEIYVQGEVFDSKLNLNITDFNLGQLLLSNLGLPGAQEEEDIVNKSVAGLNSNIVAEFNNEDNKETQLNAFEQLYQLKNSDDNALMSNAVEALIRMTKQDTSVILTVDLLVEIMNVLLSSQEFKTDYYDILSVLVTDAGLTLEYGDDFGINLNLDKKGNAELGEAGYEFNLTMLHDTLISLDKNAYDTLYNALALKESLDEFSYFFKIDEIANRFAVKFSLTLEADLLRNILDWSTLFKEQELSTIFQLRFLKDVKGKLRLDFAVDIDISLTAFDFIISGFNTDNVNIFNIYFVGGRVNYETGDGSEWNPKIYINGGDMYDTKIVLTPQAGMNFLDLNFVNMFFILIGSETRYDVSAQNAAYNADSTEETGSLANVEWGAIFDSITFGKGTIGIKLASSLLQAIISGLFGLDFEQLGNITLELDLINNELLLNIPIDAPVRDAKGNELVPSKLNFGVGISNVNINLGPSKDFFGQKQSILFTGYQAFDSFIWVSEINSSLHINDDFNTLIDMSQLTSFLIDNLGLKIMGTEELDVQINFALRTYIDFSDLSNFRLELELTWGDGKRILELAYIGIPQGGTIYLDLSGLGLPKVCVNGIDLGSLAKEILSTLDDETIETVEAQNAGNNDVENDQSDAEKVASNYPNIKDMPFGNNMLLFMCSNDELSIAITGALLMSLLHSLDRATGDSLPEIIDNIPVFNYLKIGRDDKDNVTGIQLVLDENRQFTIRYNFDKSYSHLVNRYKLNTITDMTIVGDNINAAEYT